ncbi:MAG: FAD-dependent oxidoreductase [Thermomicrobiales bacterium]
MDLRRHHLHRHPGDRNDRLSGLQLPVGQGRHSAYYNFGDAAARVGDMSPEERVQLALDQGGKIHPQYEDEFENGVAVAWQKMPYKQGGWATYSQDTRDQYYDRLFDPEGASTWPAVT